MRQAFAILLAAAGLALGAPVYDQIRDYNPSPLDDMQPISQTPTPINDHESEIPIAFQASSFPAHAPQKRDGRWPWQRPQPVIGKYPDGRLKCSIVTMTG